jgi:hypothetical protein
MMRSSGLALLACLLLTCCAYPTGETLQGGERGSLLFRSAPLEASIIVDGKLMGSVGDSQKKNGDIRLTSGSHKVQLVLGGKTLMDRTVYVDNGAKVILDAGS